MIAPNSSAHRRRKKNTKGEYGRIWRNGASQSTTCVIGVEWELATRGLRIVTAFWAGIPFSAA